MVITDVCPRDARFTLQPGEGADAVHTNPEYSFAVTRLFTEGACDGTGIVLTLGGGNDLVCNAIHALGQMLIGCDVEELMADFGATFKRIADHPQYRWLGPHKGVVHLALASITNACFDLWAKARGVPLWRLLLDLSPEQVVALLDLSYLEDCLTRDEAAALIAAQVSSRQERQMIISAGYPGYDTSVGWFHYDDDTIRDNAKRAVAEGFIALKLKVGSAESSRDIRRAFLVRECVGPDVRVMMDVNQQWTLPQALANCNRLAPMSPFWIEEPTHPDDVLAHQALARAIAPTPIALGEHVPNRVMFKNFMQSEALGLVQVDCTRVGGVSEFITVSLLARKFGLPVVPHVGDMGQIHQHLVLFNHVALDNPALFLEYIPHLRVHFRHPADVRGGVYRTPQEPGGSTDLLT